jgi:hydrogenase nickel incorporation protein HypA/HybF
MHEVGIMTEALQMAENAALNSGARRILKLHVRVGVLSGVIEDALRFAFDAVSANTLAAGAGLEIETVPAAWWCGACQYEFTTLNAVNECPRCHGFQSRLRRGRELEISAVEIE